jgi:predicted Zn finger-like uncharacterized protein
MENNGMLIACPNCAARYQVPGHLLHDRARPLRCGQCWAVFPIPEPPVPEPVAFGMAEPPPTAPLAEDPRAASKPLAEDVQPAPELAGVPSPEGAASRGLRAAWAASILLLIGGGLAAIIQRDAVMAAWPPAARVFGALGLG